MPRVTGWSEDEFDDRAQDLAALIRRVWRAIARLIAAQAEQQSQVTMAVAKPIMPQWQQAVDGQIIGFVRNMYLDAAGTVSDALDAPDELLIGDDMVEVYTNAARNRLVGIGDDVWKNVQAQIALGNQSGESIADIAARIRNVTGVSEGRSLTIARTEVHAAHESGSYEQAVFVDPDAEKTWLATEDTRTRPSHRAADGQTVKIGEAFNIGGSKLRYPGDPLGAPEDCINCRCSVAYNFDMITAVVDEPEPAMVAAGEQTWKAHNHPRGTDGKFIKSGIVADFLKKSSPNIIDVTKAVGNLDSQQWGKLTDAQKTHIKASVDKLPKGTATHTNAQKTIDSLEKTAAATAPAAASKPKTKIGETYSKLQDAKHGDVIATGTKYNSAGVGQKFRITADKSNIHPDYNPHGKMKLEFLKKNGEPSDKSYKGGILTISQKLHPLPAKGKKAGKVEWDEPGAPQADAPDADVTTPAAMPTLSKLWQTVSDAPHNTVLATADYGTDKYKMVAVTDDDGSKKLSIKIGKGKGATGANFAMVGDMNGLRQWMSGYNWQPTDALVPSSTPEAPNISAPNVDAPSAPAKIPTGLKGEPGGPAKITTGVVWGKHPAGTTIVESEDGQDQIVWTGKKYEFQTQDDIGDWAMQFEMSKKDFYANHKDDTGWKIPGGAKTPPPPLVPDADLLEQAYNDPNDNDGHDVPPQQLSPEAAGYDPTPDEVDWNLGQWERENAAGQTPPSATTFTPPLPGKGEVSVEDAFADLGSYEPGDVVGKFTYKKDGVLKNEYEFRKGNDGKSIVQYEKPAGMPGFMPTKKYKNAAEMKPPHGFGYNIKKVEPKAKPATSEPPQTPSTPPVSATSAPDWTKVQDFSGFTKVGGQAGSNPGGKYKAPDGAEWYLKKPKSKNHAANEQAAAAFYNLAGIDAPQVMKGFGAPEIGGPTQTGTKIVPGANPNLGSKLHDPAYIKQIQSGFAVDAWLANWDVAGMGYDNVIEGADGKPHRIDVGGSLLYRAQGTPKGDEFGNTVDELKTLRDGTNPQAAKVFGSMTDEDIRKSAAKVEAITDEQIDKIVADAGLDASVAETLKARRQDILAKYPPISEADELLNEALGPPTTIPDATSAKAKLQKLYEKGLITQEEFIDATGEPPDSGDDDMYGGIADKGVLLNDLESGAILPMPQAIDLGIMLNESDYNDLSNMEKDQLETTLSTAADMNMPGGKDSYAHWQSLHSTPTTVNTGPAAPSGPMIDGSTLGLKALYRLIQDGKTDKKYTDGQVIATSPDGTQQFVWRDDLNGYALRNTETGGEEFTSNIKTIQTIRKDAYHIPESNLPDHDGTLIESAPSLAVPEPGDPVIDTETIGATNHGALYALDNGDADEFVTIDGKWSLKKTSFSFGDSYVVSEHHQGAGEGTTSTTLFENPNELEDYSGLQVWYPKQEIDQSTNAPDATAGVSSTPVDLDVVQEKIDLGEYTAGETIGITKDGQYKITYSPFLNGLIYQHKIGNTGDDDMDWDSLGAYDGDADAMDTPVSQFVDANPDVEFFEPQDPNVATDANSSNVNWDTMLSGPYGYHDVVAQTADGKYQLVHKGMGSFQLYTKPDGSSVYSASDGTYYHDDLTGGDLDNEVLSGGYRWQKVNPGTQFKSGKIPVKKAAKAVKSAGVPKPGAYSPAVVSPNEKKFYLEDATWGSLVAVEAVHLLNGADGLDVHEAGNLTPTQTGSINTQLEKALTNNVAGAQAAWDKWAGFEQQLNSGSTGYDVSQIADQSYFLDVENDMWSGDKSTGDVFAITPDGKYRLVIHSTTGPSDNPDSFALEQHGPLGWELNKIYTNTGYDGVPGQLAADTDTMSKTWLKSDGADPAAPAASPVSFDPPGTGTQLASVIFGMLDWVPEGKTLLVGKDDNGDKFKMVAGKDISGKKVINVDLWYPNAGEFKGWAQFHNENEYNDYVDDPIKWDAISELPDKSALDDFMGNPNSPAAPSTPTAPLLPLTSNNADAIWVKAQTLDVGTVIGTTISGMGTERRLIVGLTGSGTKTITVQQKDASGNWKKWNDVSTTGLKYELDAYIWTSEIHDTPTPPSSPSSFVGKKLSGEDDAQNLWDAAQTLPVGTVLATGKNSSGVKMRMVSKTHADGSRYVEVQKDYDENGSWQHAWNNNGPFAVHDDLIDDEFYSALDPGTSAPTSPPVLSTGNKLEPSHSKALWAAAQNLGEDTVVATGTNSSGAPIQMVVKKHIEGYSILSVQKKHPVSGAWNWWYGLTDDDHLNQDLGDENWFADIDVPGVPDTSASPSAAGSTSINDMTGLSPDQPVMASYWGKLNSIKNDVPGGTIVAVHKQSGSTLVKKYDGAWAVEDADGTQIGISLVYTQDATNILPDDDWYTPGGTDVTSFATVTPTAPSVSTPPAPKLLPINTAADVKFHLKNSGNLGYYSKPENIWAAVKEWQTKPGNEQYSPMDIFKSLDHTLKTSKPNPFQEKMTKWAASKKGAQIIGQDGIYGKQQQSTVVANGGMPELKAANVDAIWNHIQTMKSGDIVAINAAGNKRLKVVTDTPGQMAFIYESKSSFSDQWSYYAGGSKKSLQNLLNTEENGSTWQHEGWTVAAPAVTTAVPPLGPGSKKGAAVTPPKATAMTTINGDSANDLWSSMEAAPVGTVFATGQMNPYKYRMVSVTGSSGAKILQIQFQTGTTWNAYETLLTKEKLDQHLKTQANVLPGGKYSWKPTLSAKTKAQAKAVLPDIEAGNDISGFDEAKQKSIYDKFKAEPYTYLSSPEHAIFDAFQSVAKTEGLTLGQVINIVDEQGAKKVSKPNDGLFKKKLATWVKTPEAAAHILNEPTVVTGLVKPPAYHPQYDPDLNKSQIPSFEESSKLTYDYVPNSSTATTIWSNIAAKTSDFSAAEKKALTVWTGGAYTTINGHLIKPNPSPLSSTHKSAMAGSQLGMRPSDRPMVLVRGTGFSGLGNAKNHAQLEKMVGTTWRNNGFAATSVGQEYGDPPGVYAPAFNSYPLWIEFECPPGTPMAWVTPFSSVGQSEREMLLGANLHYKILSVEKKMIPGYGMKTIARVRIVPKPEGAAA